jgi:hypothetical protein
MSDTTSSKDKNPGQAAPQDERLVCAADLGDFPPLNWLLKDRILNHSLNVIFGSSATCKSFLQIYWALQIAQTFNVVYVVGEGLYGMPKRIRACADYYGLSMKNLYLWKEPISLMNPAKMAGDFIAKVSRLKPVLIALDTFARCMAQGDESSTKDMAIAVDSCGLISRKLGGCAVSVVHHKGWDASRERGSTVLRAAADYMIETIRKDKTLPYVTVKCSKSKDDSDDFKTVVRLLPHLESAIVFESPGEDFVVEVDDDCLDADERSALRVIMDSPRIKAAELMPVLRLSKATTYRILGRLKDRKFVASRLGLHTLTTAGFQYLESHEKSQEKLAEKPPRESHRSPKQPNSRISHIEKDLSQNSLKSPVVSNVDFETETPAKVSAVSPPFLRGEAETTSETNEKLARHVSANGYSVVDSSPLLGWGWTAEEVANMSLEERKLIVATFDV